MTADPDYAGRFLNAAEDIKASLERMYGKEFKGLGDARTYAIDKNNPIIIRHKAPLKVLVDLRNVMQHSHVLAGEGARSPQPRA